MPTLKSDQIDGGRSAAIRIVLRFECGEVKAIRVAKRETLSGS
jgi:hypothetical protein